MATLTSLREWEFEKGIVGNEIGKLFGCHYYFGYRSLILFIDITLKMLRKIQYHNIRKIILIIHINDLL